MTEPSRAARQTNIDLARGLSILAVLAYHFAWLQPLSDKGLYGVLLFFFISGYCMEISASASPNATQFWVLRIARLVPALLVCALATQLIESTFPVQLDRLQGWPDFIKTVICIPTIDIPCGATQLLTHKYGHYTMVDGAYWSLRVEFKFYVLLMLIYFAVGRWHIIAFLLAAAAGGMMQRAVTLPPYLTDFIPYLPCFTAGMAIFEMRQRSMLYGCFAALAATALAIAFNWSGVSGYSIPNNIAAFFVCGLAFALFALAPQLPMSVPLQVVLFFGVISYPLYLLHQDIGIVLNGLFKGVLASAFLTFVLIIAGAYAVHHLVEYRLERIVKRWFQSARERLKSAPARADKFVASMAAEQQSLDIGKN